LTIVESPVTETYVAVDSPDSTAAKVNKPSTASEAGDTLLQPQVEITYKPITSSLRSTILHLRARAGYWSRFRGLSLFLCWAFARGSIISTIASAPFMKSPGGLAIAAVIAEVILSRWEFTWYQIVISEPSSKKWWQRVPSFKSRAWNKIAPAVALRSLTTQITSGFPVLLCRSFGTLKHLQDPAFQPGKKDIPIIIAQSLIILFLTFALFVLLEIPATVTAVRVAASMLPEEYETIVPFDRSFGGKVTPAIVGGSGKIGMLDAWRTFTWPSRIRLLKLVVKVFAMIVTVWLWFCMVLAVEGQLLFGARLDEIIKAIGGKSH
jgi:hypothetical protein